MDSIKALWARYSWLGLVVVCALGFGASATGGCSFIKAPESTPTHTGTAVDSLPETIKAEIPESGRAALGSIIEADRAREVAAVGATAGIPGSDRLAIALERYSEALRENTASIVSRQQTANSKEWDTATRDALSQSGWAALAGFLAGARRRKVE